MGLFGTANPFDVDIEKATDEKNTSENWGMIMEICDKVGHSKTGPKDCLRSIMQRVSDKNPRIALQAITLLNACISNCGKSFHLEVASRETVGSLREIITSKGHDKVAETLFDTLGKWSEAEFKADPSLDLIPSLYRKLKSDGYDFSDSEAHVKKQYSKKKETTTQEENDLMKAIAQSLTEQDKTKQPSSLYPSFGGSSAQPSSTPKTQRTVRALYDFEAAEDNELTFHTGDIVIVTDDSDVNWWRGRTDTREGLFPANFVTADLSAPPEPNDRRGVSFNEQVQVQTLDEPEEVVIDETKMDECLELLQNADPSGEQRPDPPQMQQLEDHCKAMGPLIDQELDKIDRAHAAMMDVNIQVADAVRLYNELMGQVPAGFQKPVPQAGAMSLGSIPPPPFPSMAMMPPGSGPQIPAPGPPPQQYHQSLDQTGPASMPPQGSMPPSIPQHYQQYDSIQSIQSIPASAAGAPGSLSYPPAPIPQYGSMQHQAAMSAVFPQQYSTPPMPQQQPLL